MFSLGRYLKCSDGFVCALVSFATGELAMVAARVYLLLAMASRGLAMAGGEGGGAVVES
jgi:hypothetical protein